MPKTSDLSQKFRNVRKSVGISQELLAERSGVSVRSIQEIESGKGSPTVSTITALAGALGVSVSSFFDAGEGSSKVLDALHKINASTRSLVAAANSLNRDLPVIESEAPALASILENLEVTPELLKATGEAANLARAASGYFLSDAQRELLSMLPTLDEELTLSILSSLKLGIAARVDESKGAKGS